MSGLPVLTGPNRDWGLAPSQLGAQAAELDLPSGSFGETPALGSCMPLAVSPTGLLMKTGHLCKGSVTSKHLIWFYWPCACFKLMRPGRPWYKILSRVRGCPLWRHSHANPVEHNHILLQTSKMEVWPQGLVMSCTIYVQMYWRVTKCEVLT